MPEARIAVKERPIYPYIYRLRLRSLWGGQDSPLFGKRFRVQARGALNARMVEFEDGSIHVISGNAIRRVMK